MNANALRRGPQVTPGRTIPAVSGVKKSPAPAFSSPSSAAPAPYLPVIRPSTVFTTTPCISLGSSDLDRVVGHSGIPLGSVLLLEEDGNTDFCSRIVKCFLSEGVVQNRIAELDNRQMNHCVAIGMPPNWSAEMPGLDMGSSRERKKKEVRSQQEQISVSNVNTQNDMKIAWRYGLNNNNKGGSSSAKEEASNFCHQFDTTSVLRPAPGPLEWTSLGLELGYERILSQLAKIVEREEKAGHVTRIAIPYFMHPLAYQDELLDSAAVRFVHGLKRIIQDKRAVVVFSVNTKLYPRKSQLIALLESLSDAVLQLRPFPFELQQLLERTHRREPAKVHQGHLNIYKIPVLSAQGLALSRETELSFKNGRRRFEIEEWSIPVEDTEDDQPSKSLEF